MELTLRVRFPDLDSCTSLHSLDPDEDDLDLLGLGPRRLLAEQLAPSGSELSSRISPLSALLSLLLDLVRDLVLDRLDLCLLLRPPL